MQREPGMVKKLSDAIRARTCPLVLSAMLAIGPAKADVVSEVRLTIGNTGIGCLKAPCPWRGIVEIDNPERDPLRPLWSGEELPPMQAAAADIALLQRVWAAHGCLVIRGRFDGKTLHVGQMMGPCP